VNRPLASVRRMAGPLRTAASRDFAWGFVSQGSSSVTNLGLSILAGRLLGPSGLGSIFVGFSFYVFAMGFLRSLITDPLVAATASLDEDARRGATHSALTMALLLAAIATVLLIVTAVTVPSKVGHGLILFVPWLAPALVQDFWRSVLFRDRRGAAGALNDALWFAGMAVTLPAVLLVRTDWIVVANWGFGASVAAGVGFIQSRITPAGTRTSLRWWRMRAWKLGRWLAAETLVYTVAAQLVVFILAGILGTRPLGGLRAVVTLFGPLSLLAPALALPGLPALSRASAESVERAVRLALSMGVLAVLLTGGYLAVAATFGDQLLEGVFGPSFTPFGALILPIGVYQIVVSATMGCALLLKAQARGRALLVARVVGSVSTLVLVLSLATTHGITGAAWGLALAGGLSSLVLVAYALGGWFPAPHALRVRTPTRGPVVGSTHVTEPGERTPRESPPD
jgi:O-antigen/teichoic acid export membrane protein